MSWSGPPSGGGPPYQPAPYPPQQPYPPQPPYAQPPYPQPQYGQPPYQQGYQAPPTGAPPQGGPPNSAPTTYPPKRKGNPVITRYPPPPGYRPPQPPQGALTYGPSQYPPQGYQAPPPQGYPPQPSYQAPNYPQGYQGYPPNYQPPSQGYQPGYQWPTPPQGYQPPTQPYPPPQGYPPQPYSQPGVPEPSAAPASYPPNGWQQSPPYPPASQPAPYSAPPDPSATPTSAHAQPGTGNSSPTSGPRPPKAKRGPSSRTVSISASEVPETHKLYQTEAYTINLGLDDWDHTDYDGAIWPKANEPIDPTLSLGVIIWHPATQVTRALPSNFQEAEEMAAKPQPSPIGNAESISEYFTPENAHEAFLNVRQTDDWENVKDDTIFIEFRGSSELILLEDVIANRARPDLPEDEERPQQDESMDSNRDSDWNVMDNLEQALSSEQTASGQKPRPGSGPASPPYIPPPRDATQEDILASLGVTGSPKPVLSLSAPDPADGVRPDRSGSFDRPSVHSRQPPHHHYHEGYPSAGPPHTGPSHSPPIPPPPPQRERSPSYDPWKADQPATNGRARSPARSDTSQHTAAGSDFHMDDNDPFNANAPPPQLLRSESSAGRKRSYDEAEPADGKQRQEDDYTPRIKRRQPRVAAAYGRR